MVRKKTKQHSGFSSERAANAERDEVVGQLHGGTYIVYDYNLLVKIIPPITAIMAIKMWFTNWEKCIWRL